MDCIYHGCDLKYSNGTNIIIGRNEKCFIRTNKCFWKEPCEITDVVRTRFQLKNEPIAHWKTVDNHFNQRINKTINDSVTKFEQKALEITNDNGN